MRISIPMLAGFTLFAHAHCALADTHWYVDGKNGYDGNTGLSTVAAFKNPWKALMSAQAGDTVHIMPTIVYSAANGFDRTPINVNHGGNSTKWLTIIGGDGTPAQRPKIVGTDNFAVQLYNGASWVQVINLDVSSQNVTGNASWYGMYAFAVNHITFRANVVHDSGGGGIGTNQADYVKLDSNIIYNNAYNITSFCGSGISLYELRDSDTVRSLKNFVKNNIVYNNKNATGTNACNHSDGNGIIIDDSRNSQGNKIAYLSGTFVQSNLVVGNGGRGIDIYYSDLVTVSNNTAYHNLLDPIGSCWSCGEINVDHGANIKIYNNIAYSNGVNRGADFGTNAAISVKESDGAVTIDSNLMWNDGANSLTATYTRNNKGAITIAGWGNRNVWADPLFISPTLTIPPGNFRIPSNSPAKKLGNPAYAPPVDMVQTPRSTTTPTVGAYE